MSQYDAGFHADLVRRLNAARLDNKPEPERIAALDRMIATQERLHNEKLLDNEPRG